MRARVTTCSISVGLLFMAALLDDAAAPTSAYPTVFREICETVRNHFFDPNLNGVDWDTARERYATKAAATQTPDQFAAVVNEMLSELHSSHTHYYTSQSPEYFQLCGIFWSALESKLKPFLSNSRPDYDGIEISTVSRDAKVFVADVLSGSPAAAAGIRIGDEIISVDRAPFHPIGSFAGKAGQAVAVEIKRTAAGGTQVVSAHPKLLNPTTMFLDAMKASVEVVVHDSVKIGYIHIWSYAGEIYQDRLEEELDNRLHDADALIVDLRNGWGGASPAYLRPFVVPPMTTTWIMPNGKRQVHEEAWTKPVCLLVNEGTKSGKELLTYYFKKAHRGMVVGSRTAGAVLVGKPFVLSDGSLLYLAVGDGLIDGKRPEGNGVFPDVDVPFRIEYAEGKDPQKDRAIALISKEVHPNLKPVDG
jgi:carboxyl-terminal processing protease